jgi:hypothetical protein
VRRRPQQGGSSARAQQQVINAQPGIAGEGVTEILPKGVDALAGMSVGITL